MGQIENKGVEIIKVTLHVGPDTFQPVRTGNIEDHKMHGERYVVQKEAASKINSIVKSQGKIWGVGTTVGGGGSGDCPLPHGALVAH